MVDILFNEAKAKAVARVLSVVDLINVAEQLKSQGDLQQQLELYRTWTESNADNSLLHVAYFNYGVTLSENGLFPEAREAYLKAIQLNQNFYSAYINLASVLERLGRKDQAVVTYNCLVDKLSLISAETISLKTLALKQQYRIFMLENSYGPAENSLMASLAIDKRQSDIITYLVDVRLKQCKWPILSVAGLLEKEELIREMAPLTVATYCDDPMLQLSAAYTYTKKVIGRPRRLPVIHNTYEFKRTNSERLRIGYLSSDLRGHAIGSLMAEVFGLHDRQKVEVYAYYFGQPDVDHFQSRIRADVDVWVDIGSMADEDVVEKIRGDRIDILVDVNGHSMNARTKMLSLRPAPVIVNWLGYPGSMGSAFHNYIISDDFIIPKEYEIFYSEKVKRLPCYQPNDRKRSVSASLPSRSSNGLPEGTFVYCCFNHCQKISQETFVRWMDILRQVPESVLWLLGDETDTNNRLKESAKTFGVSPERLIFADRLPNSEHLARYQLADLFLDTYPYGAHTTCSDALWMGVPVLTLAGHSFASRVCGSLVCSAGMPELLCSNPEEYVSKAVELGLSVEGTAQLKKKMIENKSTCVLFDMSLLVRSLEELYMQMWDEFAQGTLHKPDLANLDVYHEIGAEIDHESGVFPSLHEYRETYRIYLENRHSFIPVRYDRRLWPE